MNLSFWGAICLYGLSLELFDSNLFNFNFECDCLLKKLDDLKMDPNKKTRFIKKKLLITSH